MLVKVDASSCSDLWGAPLRSLVTDGNCITGFSVVLGSGSHKLEVQLWLVLISSCIKYFDAAEGACAGQMQRFLYF